MDIEIRELDRKDFNKVIDFAIKGMNFNRYVEGKTELRLYGRYFLYLELKRATQVLAAYMGDRLVGVLMADMKNEPKKYSSFWRNLYVKTVDAVMAIAYKSGTVGYDTANAAMLKKYSKSAQPDGEICFLAADPTIQGKGIGTLLLNELAKREKGKLIYLYTDSNCTYQFYEHKGFERSEEKDIEIEIHGKVAPLTCLLYSKVL
jgi:GNAT superfamily N-acetyltransferase